MSCKILGICGSYRRAATYTALELALESAASLPGIETQLIELRGRNIQACIGCNQCIKKEINDCLAFKDDMQEIFEVFQEADGYITASPIYGMGMTPLLSAYFSRFRPNFILSKHDPDRNLFRVGGAIAVGGTRNGGQENTIAAIHGLYHTKGITVINGGLGAYSGGSVWSRDKGREGVLADEIGTRHVQALGRRVAKAALAFQNGV